MGANKNITPETMGKIWTLCNKEIDKKTISHILNISLLSVERVVTIMTATANNDMETLENKYKDCVAMKKYACEILGINNKPAIEEQQQPQDNTAQAMANVLKELHRTNELLEQLCTVWNA